MMTGMQRLTAAATGGTSDRIPVFCNLLDQGARELGVSLPEYYASGERVAEAQLRMRERYGHDNVWSLFYVGKEAELLGCRRIIYATDGPPNVGDLIIRSPEDIRTLTVPDDLAGHPVFAETRRCLEILRREVGGRYPICAYLTASLTLPAILMGMEKWMDLLLSGPFDLRDHLLAKCSEFFRRELAAYRDAGADVIIYSNPFGSLDIITRRLFTELSLPWMERDLEGFDRSGIVYYCGGARMNPVIAEVMDRTGLSTYYLSPLEEIAEGKRLIGNRGVTCGVINDIPLIDWSPEQVRAEVKRLLADGMPGGRFLFGTLVMPLAIPEANIRAMVDAACEFGQYG